MKKYAIKRANVDFGFRKSNYNVKGSRVKFVVVDNKGNMAFFKYERLDYKVSDGFIVKIQTSTSDRNASTATPGISSSKVTVGNIQLSYVQLNI